MERGILGWSPGLEGPGGWSLADRAGGWACSTRRSYRPTPAERQHPDPRWPVSGGRWPVSGGRRPAAVGRWPVPVGWCPVVGGRCPV